MQTLTHYISTAWRNARKHPGTSLLIVFTLALGIGVNSALISVAWRTLAAPLPYADGERWVTLVQHADAINDTLWAVPTFEDVRDQQTTFDALLAYAQLEYTLHGRGDPLFVRAGIVEGNFFEALGITPVLGRGFQSGDDRSGSPPVMLLSQGFWQRHFGGDPTVIGTTVEMNTFSYTIVGVLPELPPYPRDNEIWVPAATDFVLSNPQLGVSGDRENGIFINVFGKLGSEITAENAESELDVIAQRLRVSWPDSYPADYRVTTRDLREVLVGDATAPFTALLGLGVLTVLIACANVANLNLSALAARSQELAVREALGATPRTIQHQLMTESLVFALAAGLLGFAISIPLLRLLAEFAASETPLAAGIGVDGSLALFTVLFALTSGVISGVATTSGPRDLNRALKEGGDKATASQPAVHRRRILLSLQVSLAFVMLTTSLLILLGLYRLTGQDTGYRSENVVVANFQLNQNYPTERHAQDFINRLLQDLAVLPGVEGAAIAGAPLLQTQLYGLRPVLIEGRDASDLASQATTFSTAVSDDYFNVMNIPLKSGRFFNSTDDTESEGVVIINEKFSRDHFPGGDPIGKRVSFSNGQVWRTIVGVVGNVRAKQLDTPEESTVYTANNQTPTSLLNVYVRTSGDATNSEQLVQEVLRRIDPLLAIESIGTLENIKSASLAPRRLIAALVTLAGVIALTITLSGVVGVISWNITRRVREAGVHMAVGATPRRITALFLKHELLTLACGVGVGLLFMWMLAPLLEPLLYQTPATDWRTYGVSALLLVVAALCALWLPAVKAGSMKPLSALRNE